MVQEVIYHHGIPGQKWGVRRYENEDGTLTAEGKARYGNAYAKYHDAKKNKDSLKKTSKMYSNAFKIAKRSANLGLLGSKNYSAFKTLKDTSERDYNQSKKDYKQAKKEYKESDEYKQKINKTVKIGVAVAGAALATYGTYKLVDYVKKNKQTTLETQKRVESLLKSNSFNPAATYITAPNGKIKYISAVTKMPVATEMTLKPKISINKVSNINKNATIKPSTGFKTLTENSVKNAARSAADKANTEALKRTDNLYRVVEERLASGKMSYSDANKEFDRILNTISQAEKEAYEKQIKIGMDLLAKNKLTLNNLTK